MEKEIAPKPNDPQVVAKKINKKPLEKQRAEFNALAAKNPEFAVEVLLELLSLAKLSEQGMDTIIGDFQKTCEKDLEEINLMMADKQISEEDKARLEKMKNDVWNRYQRIAEKGIETKREGRNKAIEAGTVLGTVGIVVGGIVAIAKALIKR